MSGYYKLTISRSKDLILIDTRDGCFIFIEDLHKYIEKKRFKKKCSDSQIFDEMADWFKENYPEELL